MTGPAAVYQPVIAIAPPRVCSVNLNPFSEGPNDLRRGFPGRPKASVRAGRDNSCSHWAGASVPTDPAGAPPRGYSPMDFRR